MPFACRRTCRQRCPGTLAVVALNRHCFLFRLRGERGRRAPARKAGRSRSSRGGEGRRSSSERWPVRGGGSLANHRIGPDNEIEGDHRRASGALNPMTVRRRPVGIVAAPTPKGQAACSLKTTISSGLRSPSPTAPRRPARRIFLTRARGLLSCFARHRTGLPAEEAGCSANGIEAAA